VRTIDESLLDEAIQRLADELHPEGIWLFGSHAWGTPVSDITETPSAVWSLTGKAGLPAGLGQGLEEILPVTVIQKNILTAISPTQAVISNVSA
jgi:hypothetical protein